MTRVFLTGATGFVGRRCLELLLSDGHDVHATFLHNPPVADFSALYRHQIDLFDAEAVSRLITEINPEYLLHLAWEATPGKYWMSSDNIRWVESSLHLLRTFVANGGKRAVYVGSCFEYDWRYGLMSEDITPLNPATLYGNCKHGLQLICDSFARQVGFAFAWARLFFLYGPYEPAKKIVASTITSLLKNEPALCSHGNQIRDYLHVHDAADALVSLLKSEITGPINIASGTPITVKHIANTIGRKIGREELIRLNALPLTTNDPPVILADVVRLKEELGWRPTFDIESGLDDTIDWWRSSVIS